MPPVGHGPDATCRAGSSPQISNDTAVPEWAHNRLQHQTSLPASPRAPRSQSARSACRPCVLRESNNATQAAPRGIPMESCQQVGSCRRQTPSWLRGAWNSTNGTSRAPHECRDHAETFLLTYQSISFAQRAVCYTFVGHAGDTTSTSPIQSFAGVDHQ